MGQEVLTIIQLNASWSLFPCRVSPPLSPARPFYKTCESMLSWSTTSSPSKSLLPPSLFTFCLPMSTSHLLLSAPSVFSSPFHQFLPSIPPIWHHVDHNACIRTDVYKDCNNTEHTKVTTGSKITWPYYRSCKQKLCIFFKAKLQKYQPIFMFPWGLGNTYLKFLCFSLFYDWGCLL